MLQSSENVVWRLPKYIDVVIEIVVLWNDLQSGKLEDFIIKTRSITVTGNIRMSHVEK